jgi:anti-sigma factor RsiW
MVNGVRTLHLLYSDGLRSISLFENATGAAADFGALHPTTINFEGHDGQYVEDGPTTLLTWKEHDIHFALVGDLLRPELIEIAKSVVP